MDYQNKTDLLEPSVIVSGYIIQGKVKRDLCTPCSQALESKLGKENVKFSETWSLKTTCSNCGTVSNNIIMEA